MSPENKNLSVPSNICKHETTNIIQVKSNIEVCFGCSSIIYINESGKKIFPIKPEKFNLSQETSTPIFLSIHDTHTPYRFHNKESYLKIRTSIVKRMKIFSQKFNLSKKTFFLALDYFDRLCSKLTVFDFSVVDIAQICVILASKFQDESKTALSAKLSLGYSKNYAQDELFILKLLNYELHSITSYDILMDIMYTGFLFNDEKFSKNKMNIIYRKIIQMLYFFSETKYFIEMTPMEIALAVIGFVRETLGLIAYNNIIKNIFIPNGEVKRYLNCLNKFRKYFKIQDDSIQNKNKRISCNSIENTNYLSGNNLTNLNSCGNKPESQYINKSNEYINSFIQQNEN